MDSFAPILATAQRLSRSGDRFRSAVSLISESSGLSRELTGLHLEQAMSAVTSQSLSDIAEMKPGDSTRKATKAALILSGNVFSAGLAPIVAALVQKVPLHIKASSEDDAFSHLFVRTLLEAGIDAENIAISTFSRESATDTDRLLDGADVVLAFGADESISAIRKRAGPEKQLQTFGHGFGVAYVQRNSITSRTAATEVCDRMAVDCISYDQRGCLSPHAIWVEPSPEISLTGFVELLDDALDRAENQFPRGVVPLDGRVEESQWRGVGASCHHLITGRTHAVSMEASGDFRPSPGWRNISVLHACTNLTHWLDALRPRHTQIKAVGYSSAEPVRFVSELPPVWQDRARPVGEMQKHSLTSRHDGRLFGECFYTPIKSR